MRSEFRCRNRFGAFRAAGWLIVGAALVTRPVPVVGTALDDYVAAPDANYTFRLVNQFNGFGYTSYTLDMTSQKWRSAADVNESVWRHWLTIIVPDAPAGTTALLWITGGSINAPAPVFPDPFLVAVAREFNTVVADLRMVPNQPLKFTDETDPRYLIARWSTTSVRTASMPRRCTITWT